MLSEIAWVVVVWIIWTGIFVLTMMLIRFTMFRQQEVAAEQEAEIVSAQTGQSVADVRAAEAAAGVEVEPPSATESALRWALHIPGRHAAPPPIGAS